jgi:hypothetical protein
MSAGSSEFEWNIEIVVFPSVNTHPVMDSDGVLSINKNFYDFLDTGILRILIQTEEIPIVIGSGQDVFSRGIIPCSGGPDTFN